MGFERNEGADVYERVGAYEELVRHLRQGAEVMGALCGEYDNIFLIDVQTQTYIHYQADMTGMHKPVLNKTLAFSNYQDGLAAYIDGHVADEDKERLRRHIAPETLLAQTPEKGINTITYRRIYQGKSLYYQLCSAKYTNDEGRLCLVLGFRDATPVVEAEQRKSAELATMQSIIEAAELGTWRIELVEGERPRMLADARMLQLLGLERDAAAMSPEDVYDAWYSRIKPEAVQSVLDSVARMEAGARDENTYLWVHPTLGERYVRCGGTAVPIEGGYRLCGYHYDVDDLVREHARQDKLLKDALLAAEHSSRSKTTFLNSMSHDIRTPMNAIMGYTELAREHIGDAAQVADYLEKIAVSSNHLLSLINDVLDMSRIESGKVVIAQCPTRLSDIVHDVRTIIQANAAARRLTFLVDMQGVVHDTVVCDHLRLQQVLLNLLSNAVKFTQPGGTIELRLSEKPGSDAGHARFEFSVRDNGIGITEEFQKHIFEPFTREQSATVSGIQGTGLGLAIAKNIVDMMGGAISVTSAPGQGSEFVVSLECEVAGEGEVEAPCGASGNPAADEGAGEGERAGAGAAGEAAGGMDAGVSETSRGPAAGKRASAPTPAERAAADADVAGIRVLLVEDNEMNREIATEILSYRGITVQTACDGDEAVEMLAKAQPGDFDLVLMDIQMPHMNGYEATHAIRALANEGVARIPIIALSANAFDEDRALAEEAGMDGYIVKPIDIHKAIEVIRHFARK